MSDCGCGDVGNDGGGCDFSGGGDGDGCCEDGGGGNCDVTVDSFATHHSNIQNEAVVDTGGVIDSGLDKSGYASSGYNNSGDKGANYGQNESCLCFSTIIIFTIIFVVSTMFFYILVVGR